jgi:hypothetical protein
MRHFYQSRHPPASGRQLEWSHAGSDINSRRPVAFAFLFTALATFHASLKSSLKVEIVSRGFSGFVTRLRPQNDDNLHSLFICNVSPNWSFVFYALVSPECPRVYRFTTSISVLFICFSGNCIYSFCVQWII